MSILDSDQPLRPAPVGLKGLLAAQALAAAPLAFGVLRQIKPILRLGSTFVVTRYDDVIEVFQNDSAFDTPYKANIDVLTGGEPFFLGMRDTAAYHADIAAMRDVIHVEDLPALGDRAEAIAEVIVTSAGGRIDIVGDLVRKATFSLYSDYFGIPEPEGGHLDVWSTRMFEFQFASSPKDVELRSQVDVMAPALRDHIDHEIARRKQLQIQNDDVLGRCLARQADGDTRFTDIFIRTNLLCMVVGGPPQVPMVTPQALEQLLRRPCALKDAMSAATADNDDSLRKIVHEAMRFDPLAPGLPRNTIAAATIAKGTSREMAIPVGATVITAFASAMMDPRRVGDPKTFNPDRLAHEYIHFGHGQHECFGRHLNNATLHRMLKPLLRQKGLRRASGKEGRLSKNGIFAEKLVVEYTRP